MGQHKHNPNVELAKAGLLPPKSPKLSKRETEELLHQMIYQKLVVDSGLETVLNPEELRYLKG